MMRRFYASQSSISGDSIVLDPEQSRHLRNVLRLTEGADALVFDGRGNEYLCRIERIERNRAVLVLIEKTAPKASESELELILATALIKGEKFDLVIQKAVELGVVRMIPIISKRCEQKSKNPAKRMERWEKIVIEASKQTGRARLMEIGAPSDFDSFVASSGPARANFKKLLFAEAGGGKLTEIGPVGKLIAVVGPEGGWEQSEIEHSRAHGFQIVTLGPRILRAETAAIAIAGILQNRFGDLN